MMKKYYKKGEILIDLSDSFKQFADSIGAIYSVKQFVFPDVIGGFSSPGELIIRYEQNVIQLVVEKKYSGAVFSLNADFCEDVLSSENPQERNYRLAFYACDMFMVSKIPIEICMDTFIHQAEPPIGSRAIRNGEGDVILWCNIRIIEEMLVNNQILLHNLRNESVSVRFETLDLQLVEYDAHKEIAQYNSDDTADYSIMDYMNEGKSYEMVLWCCNMHSDSTTTLYECCNFANKLPLVEFHIFEQIFFTLEDLGVIVGRVRNTF